MKKLFMTPLCRCNNCETILVDENPQIHADLHQVYVNESGQWIDGKGQEVASMEYFEEEGGRYIGCPICETDGYLTDEL